MKRIVHRLQMMRFVPQHILFIFEYDLEEYIQVLAKIN